MNYKKWEPLYIRIIKDFKFDVGNDIKSAEVLNTLLQKNGYSFLISKLKILINNKEIFVFGAGPSLETSIVKYKERFADNLKIAADGATTALLKNDIRPDVIVTDLDGKVSDQLKANMEGSTVIIHAHGDNIDKIKKYVPEFKGEILGSTQVDPEPYDLLYNFGGFTDGDRAVFLANHFCAKDIYLIGFDFNNEIGEYSFTKHKDRKLKLKKLKWCKYLIDELHIENRLHYI